MGDLQDDSLLISGKFITMREGMTYLAKIENVPLWQAVDWFMSKDLHHKLKDYEYVPETFNIFLSPFYCPEIYSPFLEEELSLIRMNKKTLSSYNDYDFGWSRRSFYDVLKSNGVPVPEQDYEKSVPFETMILHKSKTEEDEITGKEKRSVAKILKVLAIDAGLDISRPHSAAAQLQLIAARKGMEIPKDSKTLAKFLAWAADA